MNQIVSRWNRYVLRPKITSPDVLTIDDEQVNISETEMAARTRSRAEKKPHKVLDDKTLAREGKKTIVCNEHAVVELVLQGSRDRVESLLVQTTQTVKRLGVRWKRAVPFTAAPRGAGGTPSIRDIIRWLDALTKDQTDAVAFLCRLHKTVIIRLA